MKWFVRCTRNNKQVKLLADDKDAAFRSKKIMIGHGWDAKVVQQLEPGDEGYVKR